MFIYSLLLLQVTGKREAGSYAGRCATTSAAKLPYARVPFATLVPGFVARPRDRHDRQERGHRLGAEPLAQQVTRRRRGRRTSGVNVINIRFTAVFEKYFFYFLLLPSPHFQVSIL